MVFRDARNRGADQLRIAVIAAAHGAAAADVRAYALFCALHSAIQHAW